MRIKLEYEDRLVFSTVIIPAPGLQLQQRTLVVKVGDKAFSVWCSIEPLEVWQWRGYGEPNRYLQEIDAALIAAMEQMLTKILADACAAVPEGANLLP